MRTDVEFRTEDGVMLRGWHYRPDRGRGPWPTIVMAHGFSAVKEMYLDRFAEAFAAAGLAALVFDNRNFGASERRAAPGDRPWQVKDYRDAITYALTRSKPTARASGSGARATRARTCSCSAPPIAASSASRRRCR